MAASLLLDLVKFCEHVRHVRHELCGCRLVGVLPTRGASREQLPGFCVLGIRDDPTRDAGELARDAFFAGCPLPVSGIVDDVVGKTAGSP